MAYADIYNAANDTQFQGRCLAAMWKAATDVLAEDPQTPNYAIRRQWAFNVLRGRVSISPQILAMQVLRNPTVAANPGASQDTDLDFVIASYLDDIISIG